MRVYVSYSRGDGSGAVALLTEMLSARLGAEVLRDIESVAAGADFGARLRQLIERCDACVAVIGPRWSPAQVIGLELEAALEARLPVIPVLIEGARMPSAGEVPASLAPLAGLLVYELRPAAFQEDLERLLAAIAMVAQRAEAERAVSPPPDTPAPGAMDQPEMAMSPAHAPGARGASAVVAELLQRGLIRGVVPAGVVASGPAAAAPASVSAPPTPAPVQPAEAWGPGWRPPAPPLSGARPHGLRRIALGLAAGAASVAIVYELIRQVFGSFPGSIDTMPGWGAPADVVDCTVFAPPAAAPGQSILVQVFAHLAEQTDDARALATEFDSGTRRRVFHSLREPVPRGATLAFELRVRQAAVDTPVQSLVWRGRAESVQFEVALPATLEPTALIGTVLVSLDGVPVGEVRFKLDVVRETRPGEPVPGGESATRYRSAFVSYASADRDEVLKRLQMLRVARISYFKDLLDLEPGERWWPRLQSAIDECDLFLLFWSSRAKRSDWVRREVAYALSRQAGDELAPPAIWPVILEGPPPVEPWTELADLHFNDRLLYFMSPGSASTRRPASGPD